MRESLIYQIIISFCFIFIFLLFNYLKLFKPYKKINTLLIIINLLNFSSAMLYLIFIDNNYSFGVFISNMLIFLAIYFKIEALNRTIDLKNGVISKNILIIFLLAFLVSNIYLTFINPNQIYRSVTSSLGSSFLFLVILLNITRSKIEKDLKLISKIVILFLSLLYIERVFFIIFNNELSSSLNPNIYITLQELSFVGTVFFYPVIILILVLVRNTIKVESTADDLDKLNKEKDMILSILGHDLRTPFNSLLGFSSLMLNYKNLSAEKVYQFSKSIFEVSSAALNQLENLLRWANLNTIGEGLQMAKIDLEDLQSILIEQCENLANEKGITLSIAYPKDTFIYANTTMMNSVLFNLVNNAIKFSYPGSEVFLEAKGQEKSILFNISDKGMGIPKEKLQTLLNSEVNKSTSGTSNETGTGLGLVICQEMIKRQGGQIWVESTEGKGTTFYFTIPKWSEEMQDQTEAS